MTGQQQATAILAALNAALPVGKKAFDLDDVPDPRPAEYTEVTLSRRFGGNLNLSGSMNVVGTRVTVRCVSQTSVANVRASLEKCRAALEFKRLTIGSKTTTPIQFETEDPAGPDDTWFSGLMSFTFAL